MRIFAVLFSILFSTLAGAQVTLPVSFAPGFYALVGGEGGAAANYAVSRIEFVGGN